MNFYKSLLVTVLLGLQPTMTYGQGAEGANDVQKFLDCIKNDMKVKVAPAQDPNKKVTEIEAIYEKPKADLTSITEAALRNSPDFLNNPSIPGKCKKILIELAQRIQKSAPK